MACQFFNAGWIHPRTGRPGPAGTWCETEAEAQARAIACPSNCFIYDDGPASHPYRPIPGRGPCAHWVAHQLGIRVGESCENCRMGFSVKIDQITHGKVSLPLINARPRDIWTNNADSHSGVIVNVNLAVIPVQVQVSTCNNAGNNNVRWRPDGKVWQ